MANRTAKRTDQDLWTWTNVFLVCGLWSALKSALVFCYCSTDFEVHRNWMSITANLPLSRWYLDKTSLWTLDYPPFFAYFEWVLAQIAQRVDSSILVLQSSPFMSRSTLLFQRFSVIFCDVVFYTGCAFLAESFLERGGGLSKPAQRSKFTLFVLLVMNPSLVLLDNVHFQYNSMMYGVFCCALGFLLRHQWLRSAFLFSVLLNFKHIYLYYVPALMGSFISGYLLPVGPETLKRSVLLGLAVGTPLLLSFGPFLLTGGIDGVFHILSRLFPFKRGLTHSYWAPNFWALYNFADYVLYCIRRVGSTTPNVQPRYTSGIVDTYDHMVLPNIQPWHTHLFVFLALVPVLGLSVTKTKNKFLKSFVLSAFAFFIFSWHVHEKATLLIQIPMNVWVLKDLKLLSPYMTLSLCTIYAQLPLIYANPVEDLLKYSLAAFYTILQVVSLRLAFQLSPKQTFPTVSRCFAFLFVTVEIYKLFVHKIVFGVTAEFLPLMLTSTTCAVGVLCTYFQVLWEVFEGRKLSVAKSWLLGVEKRAKEAEKRTERFDVENLKYVAGLDISCLDCEQDLAVVSCTVVTYPNMEVVYCADELVVLQFGYTPEYLALREAEPLVELVNRVRQEFQIDLLLIDGNGTFHSRACGLAVVVGYLSNVPSIGVAKNFGGLALERYGLSAVETRQEIKQKCNSCPSDHLTTFELKKADESVLAVYRGSSVSPVFVSPGFGVRMSECMKLMPDFILAASCYPIRLSDGRGRSICRRLLDRLT